MASFTGIIYLTVNQINGKVYVGQTSINKNGYIGSGKLLKRAIKKYGKDNFARTILRSDINSLKEASTLTGVKRAAIANNLAGLSKSAGGYIFKYKND